MAPSASKPSYWQRERKKSLKEQKHILFCPFFSIAEVQAIASMIEKQAQIVVKQKEVSAESKKRKEALLAQYANVTDEEEYPWFIDWKNSKSAVSLAIIHIFHHAKEMRETVCLIQCSHNP